MLAFQEQDKDLFFGRDKFVKHLVQAVDKHTLVPVIGASGSGKSSVVFAGLIPRLRKEGTWLLTYFRPQTLPFYSLASALVRLLKPDLNEIQECESAAKWESKMKQGELWLSQVVVTILKHNPRKRILLVVDQFEELYSLCTDEKERQQFLDQLLSAIEDASVQRIPNFTLVFTLRADFYGYMLSYRRLVDALGKFTPSRLPSLGPMTPQELQQVIEKPVEKLVEQKLLEVDSGLTERILEDLRAQPGNLPLLEFALTRLWHKQQQGKLTHSAYLEMGGVKKALASHAEAVYGEKFSLLEQEQVQRIFVQLVCPGEGTENTRRLATRTEVGEENWYLVQELAKHSVRLVVTGRNEPTGEETVEVAHEALIREWQSLRDWMERERDFRAWQERLRVMMRQWKSSKNDDSALLRGFSLDEAADWLEKRLADMSSPERGYIQLSLKLREKEIKQRKNQQQRIIIARTTAFFLGILGVTLIVLLNRQSIITAFITANKKNLEQSHLLKNFYLPRVDLSGANLRKANISQADLEEANLEEANLQGAYLQEAYMQKANFSKANLSQANLLKADLKEANLEEANLQGAYLQEAYMQKANFSKANLSQANLLKADLKEANLEEANLQGVKNLNPDQIKQAHNWQEAEYDEELRKKLGLK